jgi:hypothetical protein
MEELNFMLYTYLSPLFLFLFAIPFLLLLINIYCKKWWKVSFTCLGYGVNVIHLTWIGLENLVLNLFILYLCVAMGSLLQLKSLISHKRVAAIIVLFSLMVGSILFFLLEENEKLSPPGTIITESVLQHDLQLIDNEHVRTNEFIEIKPYNENQKINLGNNDSVNDNDHYIRLSVRSKKMQHNKNDSTYGAVHHAMLVWLYIQERQLPFSVVAIEVSYSSWSLSSHESIVLSRYDFENVSKNLSSTVANKDVYVRELTHLWIKRYLK